MSPHLNCLKFIIISRQELRSISRIRKNFHQTGWRISEAIEVHQVRSKVVELIYLICTEQMKPFKFQFNLFFWTNIGLGAYFVSSAFLHDHHHRRLNCHRHRFSSTLESGHVPGVMKWMAAVVAMLWQMTVG